jgi:Flp pilus assembly protein TadG
MKSNLRMGAEMRRFAGDDRGSVTVWSLFLCTFFALMGGLAVDYANGIRVHEQLQATADAAALAAAIDLPDTGKATSAGMAIASQYLAPSGDLAALKAGDFTYGNLNAANVFVPNGAPINAVRVQPKMFASRSNALPTYLLKMVGVSQLDVQASALAATKGDASCKNGGFFSDKNVLSGSNNDYIDGFCLYGKAGVKVGSDNSFEDGVEVAMANLSTLIASGGNAGLTDALAERTYSLVMPSKVDGIITAMEGAATKPLSTAGMPTFITKYMVCEKIEAGKGCLKSGGGGYQVVNGAAGKGFLFIVKDVADFGSNAVLDGVAVVAKKEIKLGSNSTAVNIVFATPDSILIDSHITIGNTNYCNAGSYTAYLFSGKLITFGSENRLRGIQMASKDEIKLGSQLRAAEGIYAEATGNFDYSSADTYGGCPNGLTSNFGGSNFGTSTSNVRYALID